MEAARPSRPVLDEMLQRAVREHLIDRYRKGRKHIVIRQEGLDLVLSHEEAAIVLEKMLHYQWRAPHRSSHP